MLQAVATAAATATTETTATNTSTISATTTGITGGSVSAMTPSDKEFVTQVAYGGAAEVAKSLIAAGKATNADVKAFAQKMIVEHGRSNEELQRIVTAKGLAFPTALDEARQEEVDRLQEAAAPQFDRVYVNQMIQDHQKTIAMFEAAQATLQDQDVRTYVTKMLPALRQHLEQAKRLLSPAVAT